MTKMRFVCNIFALILLLSDAVAFAPIKSHVHKAGIAGLEQSVQVQSSIPSSFLISNGTTKSTLKLSSKSTEGEGFFDDLTINPFYASLWILFVSVATYFSATEVSGASQGLIESFIADPLHPNFGSSLFETEWNAIGLVGLPLATLIMPGAKGQKLNPTPFLFASSLAGFGSLGIFMMTRTSIDATDLGWFTKNVLENKIFNFALFLLLANAYIISGAGQAMVTDPVGTLVEFKNMIGGSALGTATTVDFSILCLTGASLIPEDLKRRGVDVDNNVGKVYGIAASTLLLPAAGMALYSALRPKLIDE